MIAHGAGDDGDDARLGSPADLQDEGGDLTHDPGLVQAGTDDHHGDDGDDGVRGEAVEQVRRIHQSLLQTHDGGEQRGQSQQHHHGGGGYVHSHDLEGKQVNGEKENTADPGDLHRGYDVGHEGTRQREYSDGNPLLKVGNSRVGDDSFFVCQGDHRFVSYYLWFIRTAYRAPATNPGFIAAQAHASMRCLPQAVGR